MSYLVIQGLEVETPDLKAIAKLSGASRIEGVGHNAFRLHDYKARDGVAEYCAKAKLDFAFITQPRRLSDFRLLVMDMDSTLITIETIDELADLVGRKAEVAAVTAQAMRGEIEYDESIRRRVAVLKGTRAPPRSRVKMPNSASPTRPRRSETWASTNGPHIPAQCVNPPAKPARNREAMRALPVKGVPQIAAIVS